jgi:hypothetical protein
MNNKTGGSLASNRVHRLLKGDCKKGGKHSRAKKSKRRTKKPKAVKRKKRTKKPKAVKRKKRTRNKKPKKKMIAGGFKNVNCDNPYIVIRGNNGLNDLHNHKRDFFTCPEKLSTFIPPYTLKFIFTQQLNEEGAVKKRKEILKHMQVQAMIYLLGETNTSELGDFYKDAVDKEQYFHPNFTGDVTKFKNLYNILKKISTYDTYSDYFTKFFDLVKVRSTYYRNTCKKRKSCEFTRGYVKSFSKSIENRFIDILTFLNNKQFTILGYDSLVDGVINKVKVFAV